MNRPKVMVFIDWFAPGFRAGGPIRSVINLITALSKEIDFRVVTGDRDLGESSPYTGIRRDEWTDWEGKAQVWYCSPGTATKSLFKELMHEFEVDTVYLNSMYSKGFTLAPLRAANSLATPPQIVLAPRGMLAEGALSLKSTKKRIFLTALKWSGWLKKVRFQATSPTEKADIFRELGRGCEVVTAENLPRMDQAPPRMVEKQAGKLKLVWVARISPVKNLHFLLKALSQVEGEVELFLYGPVHEEAYVATCRRLVEGWNRGHTVHWEGALPPAQIRDRLHAAHLFVLPTLGENFGHGIFEALLAGRPILVSDRTPWNEVREKRAGFALSLENPEKWTHQLNEIVAWEQETWEEYAENAWEFAAEHLKSHTDVEKSIALLTKA